MTIMPTRRSYGDSCGIARALDVVGERWALLVVRELLLAPQRFSELRGALPNAASNILADRLHELEDRGVIRRRRLPFSPEAWAYELTDWGRKLEPIVLALGEWGLEVALPPGPRAISASSALLFMRGIARPGPNVRPTTCRLELDEQVWTLEVTAGRLDITAGEPASAECSLATNPLTLVELLEATGGLDAAESDGRVRVRGSKRALRRVLRAVSPSSGAGSGTPPT
jgi:DNA-binding HxlR family transcriptional regulator